MTNINGLGLIHVSNCIPGSTGPLEYAALLLVSTCRLCGLYLRTRSNHFIYLGRHTVAPLLAVVFLTLLVFSREPFLILCAIPLFTLESYFLIADVSKFPLVRAVTVAVAGAIAFFVCLLSQRAHLRSMALESLLYAMPVPWLLTDPDGQLIKVGQIPESVAPKELLEGKACSIFSIFSFSEGRNAFVGKFLDVLQENPSPVVLQCRSSSNVPVKLTLIPFVFESRNAVLAIPQH